MSAKQEPAYPWAGYPLRQRVLAALTGAASPARVAASDTTIPIPLSGGERWAVVTLPTPMSEAEWRYLLAVLDAMKPGFVPGQAEDSTP